MNSIVEAKVNELLINWYRCKHEDCGTVIEKMRMLAQAAGHDLDDGFRFAGLSAGPEARCAATIVDKALLGGGCDTSDYDIRKQIAEWTRRLPRKGKR